MGIERLVQEKSTQLMLTMLVGGMSLRTFNIFEAESIDFMDEALQKDLGQLLDILFQSKKKDTKKLTIFARGVGKRRVFASYIIESPVWKTSYRVMMHDDKATIQGWAVVDNTTDEDWEDVNLSLMSGLPMSFVHDLYTPRYKRRTELRVEEENAFVPPTLESGFGGFGGAAPASASMQSTAFGFGDNLLDTGMMAAAPRNAPMAAFAAMPSRQERQEAAQRSMPVQTRTAEIGDLFQYEIDTPVTVKRNQSALVPIAHQAVQATRVAIYNESGRSKNPMSALLLKNTTGLTLEGGPLTVLENDCYVGEAMLDTMKPDEERHVPYSIELGCVITRDNSSSRGRVHQVSIRNQLLSIVRYTDLTSKYTVQNKLTRALDLFIDHPKQQARNCRLHETAEPCEVTENFYRFRMTVEPKTVKVFTVTERGDDYESVQLQSMRSDYIQTLFASNYITAEVREKLQEIAGLIGTVTQLMERIQQLNQNRERLHQDNRRIRENLGSLAGMSGREGQLRDQFVENLSRIETEIAANENQLREHMEKKNELATQFQQLCAALSFSTEIKE
eukprot:TRINITY_DN4348_c0_g1_i4.p1 TRINITY_DN4348_c0_g1~~TRINITY_DN4348_c0_g1_i4.p1  ORF type:complete len:561 (-),score=155.68 TRINITY_DN4348_c0_g1_i4:1306-2988(-)